LLAFWLHSLFPARSGSGTFFVLAALLGVVNAVDIPSRQAFVADLVARDHLMNAIALNSSMFNGARVVGPAVAGVLWPPSAKAGASSRIR